MTSLCCRRLGLLACIAPGQAKREAEAVALHQAGLMMMPDGFLVSSFQFPPDVPGRQQRQGHHDFMQGEMALWKGKGMVGRQSRQRRENFSPIVLFALYGVSRNGLEAQPWQQL